MGRTLRYWHLAFALTLAVRPIPLRAQPVPAGPEFQVNTYTTGQQSASSVAFDPTGGFVALWDNNPVSSTDVVGRRYDSNGAPLGGEFPVNSYTTGLRAIRR